MPRITVYIPDAIAQGLQIHHPRINRSKVCADALGRAIKKAERESPGYTVRAPTRRRHPA